MVLYVDKVKKESNKNFLNQPIKSKERLNINNPSILKKSKYMKKQLRNNYKRNNKFEYKYDKMNTIEKKVIENFYHKRRKIKTRKKNVFLGIFKFLIFLKLFIGFLSYNAIVITLRSPISSGDYYPVINFANIERPENIYFDDNLIEATQYDFADDNYLKISFTSTINLLLISHNYYFFNY